MLRPTGQGTVSSLPDLYDPEAFSTWWERCVELEHIPANDLASMLENVGTDIALVRASMVLGYTLASKDRTCKLAGAALNSSKPAVRLLALYSLAMTEIRTGFHSRSTEQPGEPVAITLFEHVLMELDAHMANEPLLTEVRARACKGLAEAQMLDSSFETARRHTALAIAYGRGVGLRKFVSGARMLLGNVAINEGRPEEARAAYQQVLDDLETPGTIRSETRLYLAVSAFWMGDDEFAQAALQPTGEHTSRAMQVYRECLMALMGRNACQPPEDYREVLPNALATLFECHHLLARSGQRRRSRDRAADAHLADLRPKLDALRLKNPLSAAYARFLRCLVSLRLGEVGGAVHQVLPSQSLRGLPLTVRALHDGLAIEIALHPLGRTAEPLLALVERLEREILEAPLAVRTSVAKRFSLFLPLAGAFLAYSPHALDEFFDICGNSVIDNTTRPITVFGNGRIRPVHAVNYTLRSFGYDVGPPPDGGGELKTEQQALLRQVGDHERWLTPIPPAQIVFGLLKLHEAVVGRRDPSAPTEWRDAALSLIVSRGLLPSYRRGPHLREYDELSRALDLLVAGRITSDGFSSLLTTLPKPMRERR